jgi:acyl-CoA synthetase (AMP-forming)/AMP-acid ligase II
MNAYALFENSLRQHPDRCALVSGAGSKRRDVSFRDLDRQVDAVATQLSEHGLGPGDRVLLAIPMSIETYVVMLAVMKAGMITMFIDPAQRPTSVALILRSWPPTAVVATRAILLFRFLMPELRRIPQRFVVNARSGNAITLTVENVSEKKIAAAKRSPADSALLTFTSGSTGEAKPVLRTHGFLHQQLKILDEIADVHAGDIDFVAMPMFVLFNLANATASVIPAADMKRPGRADPVVLFRQMRSEHVTRTVASPALLERLANYCLAKGLRLNELRCVCTGGGPVSPLLARKLRRVAPFATIKMVYGSTEAEPIACLNESDVSITDRNRVARGDGLLAGKPVPGCQVRIIDSQPGIPVEPCSRTAFDKMVRPAGVIGEITVSGNHVMTAYADASHNRATKIEVNGTIWHRTGDAGYFDVSGRLWLVGRCAAVIHDSRGIVYPFQVEYAVNAVNGIRRAALIGWNNERVLVVEAAGRECRSDCVSAARCVSRYEIDRIVAVRRILMDKRHDAKVDYPALRRQLDGSLSPVRFILVGAISSSIGAGRLIFRELAGILARGIDRMCAR